MQYTKTEVRNFNQKDKRISFLSIWSSPKISEIRDFKEAFNKTVEIVEDLYEKYPIIEEGDEGMEVIDANKPMPL